MRKLGGRGCVEGLGFWWGKCVSLGIKGVVFTLNLRKCCEKSENYLEFFGFFWKYLEKVVGKWG